MTLYVIAGLLLLVVGAAIFFLRFGKSAGQDAVVADVAVKTVDVVKDMAQAQADAPTGKTEIVKRLREKGL